MIGGNNMKLFMTTILFSLFTTIGVSAIAQDSADLNLNDQAGGTASSQKAPASADDNWHFAISPYLWFAGVL